MRLGTLIISDSWPDKSIGKIIEFVQYLESMDFDQVWMANIFDMDAITTLAVAGQATSRIRLGTAVVPVQPRHPMAMAQQALTAAAVSNERFTLGIGLSHKVFIEDYLGLSYAHPRDYMREYLQVLLPMMRGEAADHAGTEFRVKCQLKLRSERPVPTVIAALGPLMLELAGSLADGTITWMTGPKTLASHIIPAINHAASAASRPAPMVVAGLPVALCRDVTAARAQLNKQLELYSLLPSYRAMLDREGSSGAGDIAVLGDEDSLREQLLALKAMGVTDLNAAVLEVEAGSQQRTLQFLADVKSELA